MSKPPSAPDAGRRAFHRAALATLALPLVARAQPAGGDSPHKALYMYKGADRDARLAAGARKEREVVIYTSLNLKDSVPLTDAFEKKTGLKVQLWRASSEKVLQRAITEARAGRFSCDILETNGPEMEAMYREKLLEEFHSPHFPDLPAAAFPKHRHYVADRFNFFTIGYNTNLVKPEEVPNAYEDLVHPRWAGRVGLEGSDVDWFGAIVKSMGEEKGLAFFRKLAAAGPQIRTGHTLMAELVASGEIPLAATLYNHNVERLTVKGAPVKWKAIQPTFGRPNAIGVARKAPHPHAGMTFVDFMLSKEGQTILKERNRVPASLSVDTHLNKFPFHMIDPVITLDENDKWEKIWTDLFLKGKKIEKEAD
ncbi:MAG TPA: extracellular solute-binding protein [Usitatibacter sp.]|nr:extracellular solute-binding protein [Usitatibacter sp.]